MKPAPFEYVLASDLDGALALLANDDDARPLAGGQSLVPLMNARLARPSVLVDLNNLPGLSQVRTDDGMLRLGALCRHRTLEHDPAIRERAPLVAEGAGLIGYPAIRNRGTLGGSLAHADPAAELGAVLLVLDGQVTVGNATGRRVIPGTQFFSGFFTTALDRGDLILEVSLPVAQPGDGYSFQEFAPRHGDFAIVGVAAWIGLDQAGVCRHARAAACGLATTPVDLSPALGEIRGQVALSAELARQCAQRAGQLAEPVGDVHAEAEDRRELCQLLLVDAVATAWTRAKRS
jgi:carbon-monoxide dehydrogenase medium subunit